MDGQTRRYFLHKQLRALENKEMIRSQNQPKVARQYRENNLHKMTPAEKNLLVILRQIEGIRFVAQKPLKEYGESRKFYIADFYIPHPHRIVIEADGRYHDDRKEYDKERDEMMLKHGIRVLRFPNEIIMDSPEIVKAKIEIAILATPAFNV